MSTKVADSTGYGPNTQMSAFGYVMAAILVIVLLPALPIIALAWVLWRAFVADAGSEPSYETWRNDPNRIRPRPPWADEEEDADEKDADA